jgi:Tfp pilus assembly protein PilV
MFYQTGLSLIEILVSFIIVSIMLLGLDAMQITALRAAKSAYYFAVATQQLNGMAERLLATEGAALNQSLEKWNKQNQAVLPQGMGTVTNINATYTLKLYWGSPRLSVCDKNIIGSIGCLQMQIGL